MRPVGHANPSGERVAGAISRGEKVEVDVWWPKDGARVSGMQPFKAITTEDTNGKTIAERELTIYVSP